MLRFYKPSEAVHQGTFEDGHHKLQKMIFMITIESLVDMGANVRLEVTPTDLKMFAESIIHALLWRSRKKGRLRFSVKRKRHT